MSTFDGIVAEFPRIRIDHFRLSSLHTPPVACFLSHVHSDHLQGLESLKSPFVYCSHATRRLLLTMEKYPHRMNFAKGILEARVQSYKHLKTVLRPIPLRTPTEIELSPLEKIRVTLFDANHCPGAVMFLIEGNGKAILYTGDVRAEEWWVNQIARDPVLIPYTNGHLRLDRIYLDTTFAVKEDVYREFPSKSSGLSELLTKIAKYPPNTIFYFRAWTVGYEDVWITLSSFLRTKIHVDEYQWRLYSSMKGLDDSSGALHGFQFGNQEHAGCFTSDSTARIHSCEPGTKCHAQLSKRDVVWITPIITRTRQGQEVLELGAGGGGGDLYQVPLLDITDLLALEKLEKLFEEKIGDSQTRSKILQKIADARDAGDPRLSLEGIEKDVYDDIKITELVDLMSTGMRSNLHKPALSKASLGNLPDTIHFPYSRHSSYTELCHLLSIFKPKDVYPCTVDPETWTEQVSMSYLFGQCCSEQTFFHDQSMRLIVQQRADNGHSQRKRKRAETLDDSQHTDIPAEESSQDPHSFETANEPSAAPKPAFQPPTTPTRTTKSPVHSAERSEKYIVWDEAYDNRLPTAWIAPSQLDAMTVSSTHVSSPEWTSKQKAVRRYQRMVARGSGNVIRWLDPDPSEEDEDEEEDDDDDEEVGEEASAVRSSLGLDGSGDSVPQDQDQAGEVLTLQKERAAQRRRQEAYEAARKSLREAGGNEEWSDHAPRSAGNSHTKPEFEL